MIGVVGAGTMGAGIAQVAATAGDQVKVYDVAPGAAARAVEQTGHDPRYTPTASQQELVDRGEADAPDVDTAMRLGTNYPRGPLEWGDLLGVAGVVRELRRLDAAHPGGRYRVADGLVRALEAGGGLRD